MQKEISKKIRVARFRLALNELIEIVRYLLLFAVVVAIGAVFTQKLLAVDVPVAILASVVSGICVFSAIIWLIIRIPSKEKVSLLIDKRLRLKERMISLMAFENSDDLFAKATCQEAKEKINNENLHGHFPVQFSKKWYYSAALWTVTVLLVAFLPQYDLLGYLQKEEEQSKQVQEIQLAEKLVKQTSGSVKLAVKQLGDEELDSELDKLAALTSEQSPEAVKRQAIQKLGDISDRIKKLDGGVDKEALEITKKMLKQLKPTAESFSQKLSQAISKGDMGLARDMIKQFQKQLEQGQMSEEQKQQLSKQLGDLAAQLSDMEAFAEKVKLMQASLDEIENAIACLGEGMCEGPGCTGPWKEGVSKKYGSGTGGPGRGFGARGKDSDGETNTKGTKVKSKSNGGQVVASWYFKGEQVKGESSKQLNQVIETARDNAAEAISENDIPRRYEESVKNYFGGLEEHIQE